MDCRNNSYSFIRKKLVFGAFLTSLIFVYFVQFDEAQSGLIPERYLKIVPGVSTRKDVEKLFGKSDPKRHFVDYDNHDFSIGIQYSLGPCDLKQSVWGFPEWTVEEVFYNWPEAKRIRLQDVLLDPKRFEKRQIGDVIGTDYYVDDKSGISAVYSRKLGLVSTIRIRPSASLIDEYACQKEKK